MRERDIPLVEISLAVRFLRQRDWLDSEAFARLLTLKESKYGLDGFVGGTAVAAFFVSLAF